MKPLNKLVVFLIITWLLLHACLIDTSWMVHERLLAKFHLSKCRFTF